MSNDLIALASIVIATAAMLATLWQGFVAKRSAQAQVLLAIEAHSIDIDFARGIDLIAELPAYKSFDEYVLAVPEADRRAIYHTISFLNYCAHLSQKRFVTRQHIWDLYFWSYRVCDPKVRSWWLRGVRRSNPRRFLTFEAMCIEVARVSDAEVVRFDQKRGLTAPVSRSTEE